MSIFPSSFSANKVGYKQYLKAGGAMQYADFMVYERRTPVEVCAEKINRFHAAMIYSYDQAMYELHMHTSDVRASHLSEAHKELNSLSK